MFLVKKSFGKRKAQEKKEKKFFIQEKGGVLENNQVCPVLTGSWRSEIPEVDRTKCVGCGICTEFCPEASMEIKDKKGEKKVEIDYDFCKGCGICSQVCPFSAIKMSTSFSKKIKNKS